MITLNFSMWELAILLVGIAFVIGVIYLVKLFKNIGEALSATTKLMEENRMVLHNILNNAEMITKSSSEVIEKANGMVDEVEGAIGVIKKDVIDPVVKSATMLKKVTQALQTALRSEKPKKAKVKRLV